MKFFKNFLLTLFLLGSFSYIGYFFYNYTKAPCSEPLKYSLGEIDPQFGVTENFLKSEILQAEALWENQAKKELFVYDSEASFKINFIYDERQLATVQKQRVESGLESAESVLQKLDSELTAAKGAYDSRSALYEKAKKDFEQRRDIYEQSVESWNAKGGAPKGEYEKLQEESNYLNNQISVLNKEAGILNSMADDLNVLLKRRNEAASEYNKVAKSYNQKYGHSVEFNQAEYTGHEINVYQFNNQKDLVVAIAHELGHALGMDHVEDPSSIMHYITNNSAISPHLSQDDILELNKVCKIKGTTK